MPKVSLVFFTLSPVYAIVGMLLGMDMAVSGDHLLAPVHAHLNLFGIVLCAVFGGFYALAGDRVSSKLAWTQFWMWNGSIVILLPTLAYMLEVGEDAAPMAAKLIATGGEVLAVLAMVVWLINIAKLWKKPA